MPERPPCGDEYSDDLGENSPIFQPTIHGLTACLHPCLHHQPIGWGDIVLWALYLVSVPVVAIIRLYRNGLDEGPDPFPVGLWVDGTFGCADNRTDWARPLKIKGPEHPIGWMLSRRTSSQNVSQTFMLVRKIRK